MNTQPSYPWRAVLFYGLAPITLPLLVVCVFFKGAEWALWRFKAWSLGMKKWSN